MSRLERADLPADCMAGDLVVALYFSDQRPVEGPAALLDWRLNGQLTRMLLEGRAKGKAGEHLLLQNNGKLKADWVLFVGGGAWRGLCRETHAALVRHAMGIIRRAGFRDLSVCLTPHEEADPDILQQQVEASLATEGQGLRICRLSCLPVATVRPANPGKEAVGLIR